MTSRRPHRIGDQIQKEISSLLTRGLKDPRIGFVTITGVDMTPDLHLAKVFYTVLGDETSRRDTERGLKKAVPFLRHELGQRIRLRYIPDLMFVYDSSLDYGERIDNLLRQAAATRSDDDSEDSAAD
ncbi:MAG: 30S ribosome-binding factor RbfA [Desulfuromonadaceae bacterium]|nr:30S ribosome-binding factor RbfA [Desulfuromonadaceae bacterium]